jgi:hypothetical protein
MCCEVAEGILVENIQFPGEGGKKAPTVTWLTVTRENEWRDLMIYCQVSDEAQRINTSAENAPIEDIHE